MESKTDPLQLKAETGWSAVIDVGTVGLIKKGIIKVSIFSHVTNSFIIKFLNQFIHAYLPFQVLGNISKIKGNIVQFESGKESAFDVIVFVTRYESTANTWLKVIMLMFVFFHAIKLFYTTLVSFVFLPIYNLFCNWWFQNGENMLNNAGLPKKEFPNHWKGANGLYCAGLARRGLAGIAIDAKNITNDILSSYHA